MSGKQPKHETTWNDHQGRILRVLNHIQEHLDEALDLDELARVACFSSYHFHRIFAAMTGETIADHVRRLRLERAATELRTGARQVIHVALDAGYESHEAFTRAFRAAYGVSPTKFRRATSAIAIRPAPSDVHYRQGIALTTFNTNHITTKAMKVILRRIKPIRAAYLRHVGPYEDTKKTWSELTAQLSADKQIDRRSVFIGIGHDNPSTVPAEELRYDACVKVDEAYEPKKPVELQTIPGGDYAVVKNCPVGKIKDAFQFLYGKWLARSWRELRLEPGFLVHVDAHAAVKPEKRRVDIYMPLLPKRRLNKAEQMKIELTTLEPKRVAYMRQVGPYDRVCQVWGDFTRRLKAEGLLRKDSLFIGVPLDNPKVTPKDKLRYDACMTIDEKYVPTKPLRVRTIAGGDYVVARNCPIGAIARGYEKLYGSWLPKSGRKRRNAPSLLMAVNHPEGLTPTFMFTDIFVPLELSKQPPVGRSAAINTDSI